jgi:hypothetical protein
MVHRSLGTESLTAAMVHHNQSCESLMAAIIHQRPGSELLMAAMIWHSTGWGSLVQNMHTAYFITGDKRVELQD